MKTSKTPTAKKAVASKTPGTKAPANKAATKNVPIRKTAPVKKPFVKAKAVVKGKPKSVTVVNTITSKHIISQADGKLMTDRFVGNLNSLDEIVFSHGLEFDISLFKNLVAIEGATAIRIFNAVNAKMEHTFVITAVSKMGKTLFLQQPSNVNTKTPAKNASRSLAGAAPPPPPPPPPGGDGVGNMGSQCPAY
jgi:hypothetical protein